jgi:hypothetical protein
MRTIIVITGSKSLMGKTESIDARPLVLLPIETGLSDDESELIERNTGVMFMAIHYPHTIKDEIIGGIIDITDPPVNPISKDEQ